LYREEIKRTDSNYLNENYWKMYGDFIKESITNQHNTHLMSNHIAEMKGMVSVLDSILFVNIDRPNFDNLKVCTK
jgi:hypothetical protein